MGDLRGCRCRLSRGCWDGISPQAKFQRKQRCAGAAPWRPPRRCTMSVIWTASSLKILPPCDKSPQRFQLTILWACCAARATARRRSLRGSTRDLLRRDGSQASPGRRLDLIEGGGIDTRCDKLLAAPSPCGGCRRLKFSARRRALYFNGE